MHRGCGVGPARFSDEVKHQAFFGPDPVRGKGGKYGSNNDLGLDPECRLTVKYSPAKMTMSVTGYVNDIRGRLGF